MSSLALPIPVLVLIGAAGITGCGVRELPAPAAPTKQLSSEVDLPVEAPAPGTSRVVLDANGQRAAVTEVTGAVTAHAGNARAVVVATRPVCTTPCVVDLPYGSHPLYFQSVTDEARGSLVDVEVGPRAKVVRHELGESKGPGFVGASGRVLVALGAVTAIVGGTLWLIGAANNSRETSQKSPLEGTGARITGIGLGGIGIGIPMAIFDPPTKRPGATTEWSPGGPGPGGRDGGGTLTTTNAAGGTHL